MLMPKKPIQGIWGFIKSMLKIEGALNKQYDSNLDGLVDNSDKVDGYDAGTGANQVLVLDANGLVPLANIPVLNWTKLQFPGVRQEILAKFTNPKILIATSSMLELLNSVEKVEAVSGNITATTKELTIVGGSATATGKSWVYWNLPEPATKVYVKVNMLDDGNAYTTLLSLMQSDGSLDFTNLNAYGYLVGINISALTSDFKIWKIVGGTQTIIATEAVDLSANVYYNVEVFTDISNIMVWRDEVLKFNVAGDTTNITEINSIQLMCNDGSTTVAKTSKFKGMVVVIYE